MAKGLKDGSGGSQLVCYHGQGSTSSSMWFHKADCWCSMPCRERPDAHEEQALRGTDRLSHDEPYLPVLSQSGGNAFRCLYEPQHRIDGAVRNQTV